MRIVLIVAFIMTTVKAFTQVPDSVVKMRIDSFLQAQMDKGKAVGFAVGIVKNGKTYYNKGYGIKELNTNKAVDSLTNFHLASISKVFVATAIMQLAEQGKINIDHRLLEYIPVNELKDKRVKEVTIRQMLIHMSGFPDIKNYHWDKPKYDSLALGNYAKECIEKEKLIFDPGAKFEYSNMAFEILGRVVETISKEPFDTYESAHILSKAGLSHSNFDYTKIEPYRRTFPHIKKLGKVKVSKFYPFSRDHEPSGTLNSCTYDMCQWILEMIKIYNDKTNSYQGVLKHRTLVDMWSPKHNFGTGSYIGTSWFLEDSPFGLCATHGGLDPGYSSILDIYPEQNMGIIILVNGDYLGNKLWSGAITDIAKLLNGK